MKTTIQAIMFSICIASTSTMAEDFNLDLEPCINGEVSASGLFQTQEAEDRFIRAKQLALEPCINGEVSESGLFSNQEAEDLYHQKQIEKEGKFGAN